MRSYWVRVPVVGCVAVGVDAMSEAEAVKAAMAAVEVGLSFNDAHDTLTMQCEELMPVLYIVRGNVFYGECSEIECEECE